MYKNIIPSLLSFDTDLKTINGFYLSGNLDFFPKTEVPHKFHYRIIRKEDIKIPPIYDFRKGYYLKEGKFWYYHRKIGLFDLKFCFDVVNKIFYLNKRYLMVPVHIGGIIPAGQLISEIINIEIFLNGFTMFKGMAFEYKKKLYSILAQSFNGKTSLLNYILEKGGKYCAEDIIIINFEKKTIFPTSPHIFNFFRNINQKMGRNLKNNFILEPRKIDKLILVQNSTNPDYHPKKKSLLDYFILTSFTTFNNPLVRAYIFEENLTSKFIQENDNVKHVRFKYEFKSIYNFNYDEIIK